MKKRILALILTVVMVIGIAPVTVFAADSKNNITVYVTVNNKGVLDTLDSGTVLSNIPITVSAEGDSVTVDKILSEFHKKYCKNGYEVTGSGWVTKLMGDTSGNYLFFVNDVGLPNGVTVDTVKNNDHLVASINADNTYWADWYTYFDKKSVSVEVGQEVSLNLKGFLGMNNDAASAVSGVKIGTVSNGVFTPLTDKVTDEGGNVKLTFNKPGYYYVSASGTVNSSVTDWSTGTPVVTQADCPIIAPSCVIKVTDTKEDQAILKSLVVHTSWSPSDTTVLVKNETDSYINGTTFNPYIYEYNLVAQHDTLSPMGLRFRAVEGTSGSKITLKYGDGKQTVLKSSATSSTWSQCLSVGKNKLEIVVTPPEGSTLKETTYVLNIDVLPSFKELSLNASGEKIYLDSAYSPTDNTYDVTLPNTVDTLEVVSTLRGEGYSVKVADSDSNVVDIKDISSFDVEISAGANENALTNKYTFNLIKEETTDVSFNVTPSDAGIIVYDKNGDMVSPNADGAYSLMLSADSMSYTYSVAKNGYVSKTGTITSKNTKIDVSLEAVPASTITDVSADWKNFRNSDVNMGITNAQTPNNTYNVDLKWSAKLGTGWVASPSVQIIVDNSLITIVGTKIYKLDLKTGKTLATGNLVGSTSYGYTPPTYADGMIFCPLGGGTIQAVNAKTLESVWVFKDNLGGQSLSPITYSDGYIYTGFWNSETKSANFVCIGVSDEDPTKTNEEKLATWKHTQAGGFYWAGSVVVGDAVIVGTDDGTSGTSGDSHLYSFNKKTGAIISDLTLKGAGDQRSSIAYDKSSGKVFFTTKGGYLCSAKLDTATGKLSELKTHDNVAQSTSTPVVYKGKVYYGAGSGISSSGSSGNIVVADADTLEVLYAIGLKGYPQCSVLLSTAYEKSTGYIYLYSTYNNMPGGISMIKTTADNKTADGAELIELYDANGYEQYCITSLICGTDGTIYYKNDSGNVFAIGTSSVFTTGISIKCDSKNIDLDKPFYGMTYEYEAVVPIGAESFDITIDKNDDTSISMSIAENEGIDAFEDGIKFRKVADKNGKLTYRVFFTELGKATPVIKLTNGDDTRTYKVLVRYAETDSSLSSIKVNNSNAYPSGSSGVLAFDKDFSSEITEYTTDVSGLNKSFYNIWPDISDENATLKVYAVENVDPEYINEDGTIDITASNKGHNRYAIYPADVNKSTVIRIEVTAEDGITKTDYTVTLYVDPTITIFEDEDGNLYAYQNGQKYTDSEGWLLIDDDYYYVTESAEIIIGWQEIDNAYYYFDAEDSGKMVTGWAQIDGKWYYFNQWGKMVTGWAQVDGKWYYFNQWGRMVTGWAQVDGKWYYLNVNGAMLTGVQKINGKTYTFNSNGVWIA